MQQLLSPEEQLFEDLDNFLNKEENQEIIHSFLILDQVQKSLQSYGIDNLLDPIFHNEKFDIDSIKKLFSLNQNKNIDSDFIKTKVQKAFEAVQQKYNYKEQFKRPTEYQIIQFRNKFAGHHSNKCQPDRANQICFHNQNQIMYFCGSCQQEHKGCNIENKVYIEEIFNTLYNNISQSYSIDGIEVTCNINPQLVAKLKLQIYEYMTGLKKDLNTNEFMIDFFQIYQQIEQFNQLKKSIEEQIILHKQKSAYQKIRIRQNNLCQHNDSKRICLESDCKKVQIFCSNCANFHPNHLYLNQYELTEIDLQQLKNMEPLSQTFKFMEILQELNDNNNQQDFNDQFLAKLAKKVIFDMTKDQIKQININKFNLLSQKQALIKDWKAIFREKIKCKKHAHTTPSEICLKPGCNYQFLCENCQIDHQNHPTYDISRLKPLYQEELIQFNQFQQKTKQLEELMTLIYFPEQYLNKLTQQELTPDQFQEEVRLALIRGHKSQLKINRENQKLNDYLKSYLQAYFSSYAFQENLQQGLLLVNQLNEIPNLDDQLNQQQKQYFNEIVDITRLHKYTISFYNNMQLIFKQIYSNNFIQLDQYDLLRKLTECRNKDEKIKIIQQYSQKRDQLMITQGQSLLFRDIQQLVSKSNRYLGLDIIYILNHKHTQETISVGNNIVQKLDIHVQNDIQLHGLLVKNTKSPVTVIQCEFLVYRLQKQQVSSEKITSMSYNTSPGLDFIKLDFKKPQDLKSDEKISIVVNFRSDLQFFLSDIADTVNYQNFFKIIQDPQQLKIDDYIQRIHQTNRGIISALILKKI